MKSASNPTTTETLLLNFHESYWVLSKSVSGLSPRWSKPFRGFFSLLVGWKVCLLAAGRDYPERLDPTLCWHRLRARFSGRLFGNFPKPHPSPDLSTFLSRFNLSDSDKYHGLTRSPGGQIGNRPKTLILLVGDSDKVGLDSRSKPTISENPQVPLFELVALLPITPVQAGLKGPNRPGWRL
jgi:hypothetical protein